jgi:ketosteroid isomerase-like protein
MAFSRADWADPEIEFEAIGGLEPGRAHGIPGMARAMREFLTAWEGYRAEAEEFHQLDDGRVLVLIHRSARGKTSGLEVEQLRSKGAQLFHLRDGNVTRLVLYWNRDRALADLGLEGLALSEESTTPELAELVRTQLEAVTRHDLDAALRFFAPDCVMEQEMGTLEGVAAIRAFFEEWLGFWEETQLESEEVLDLGNGVAFAVIRMHGRPVGSNGHVQMRFASVSARTEGLVVWIGHYTETDIEKARAAAKRLAEERG